jgi:hypothetical protein
VVVAGVGATLDCGHNRGFAEQDPSLETVTQAVVTKYDWLQFGGDSLHGNNNTLETQITQANVGALQQLFQVTLPETIEGAPVVLTNVNTPSGTHDVAYVTTRNGYIVALDAYTGNTLWSHQPATSPGITMSSPAIDPGKAYVYSPALDGKIHKYAVGDGTEVTSGGWPEVATLKPSVEKQGTAMTIATVGATNYLYVGTGGYIGDAGDYQGHITTINLNTGAQKVFNAMCSDQTVHFTTTSPDCAGQKSGIWAKAGLTYYPATSRLYAGTGNGTFAPASHSWGDTVLAINSDGSGVNGGPVDSYTPTNYQNLQNTDLDLGSTNPMILPNNGSNYAHLAVQSGKDAVLRLINLDNMSGQGGPGHVAGEVGSAPLPTGGEDQNPCSTWINPADSSSWVFIVSPSNGINAMKLSVDGGGNPSLTAMWHQGGGGGGAAIANNVLYYAENNNFRALNPTTGAQLWNNTSIGAIHWQTPAIANGVVYIGDNGRKLTAFGSNGETPLSRTGWTATASNTGGGDVPGNALDGNIGTRWSTGAAMTNGMYYHVDMQATKTFDQIKMDSGGSTNDYARGYQVFVSADNINYGSAIASGTGASAVITVQFPAQNARHIKVVQTGAASNWWSIAEFNVYTGGTPPPAPQPPSGLTATAASSSAINLSWTASPTSGVTYSAFRSTTQSFTPSPSNQIASGISGLTYGDSGLAASTTYYYYVEAVNGGGASSPSNEANATTQAGGGGGTVQINSGGPAVSPYVADIDFAGGSTINHANTIDLSGVTNPAPAAVYQTARIGNFTYTIPGFTAGSSHTVRLHFCETYFTTAGSRTFNVSINGTQVLTNYDVFASAGAKDKAVVQQFTQNANASGQYVIQFTNVVNNSLVSGIEVP